MSSGVGSRPCSRACTSAFCRTSSSSRPRTTCAQSLDGFTLWHSMILPMGPPCESLLFRCSRGLGIRHPVVDRGNGLQVREDRLQLLVPHLSEPLPRHRRQDRAGSPHVLSGAHGLDEHVFGPNADPGVLVRRQVRRITHPPGSGPCRVGGGPPIIQPPSSFGGGGIFMFSG